MNIRPLVMNALIAALYVAASLVIQPIAYSNLQFRVPEILNQLGGLNTKYSDGVVLGVLLTTLLSPTGVFDLVFGVAHTALSLGITIFLGKFITNKWALLAVNTLVFSFNMYIIAFELFLALDLPFLITWLTTAVGEIT